MFDPKTNKYPYPNKTDRHYLKVHQCRGIVFDERYPYVDCSKSFRFKANLVRLILNIIVFPLCRIRMGLRVKGKENLKKYRDVLSQGTVSVSNHVHMWDYLAILSAIRPFRSHILSWAPNVNGGDGTLIRLVGGIPIPENNIAGTKAYIKAVRSLLNNGGWLQIYAEGSMWEYYAPIRPFKRGSAHFAVDCNKPILPLGFSYRKPGWIRKNVFRQIAKFTLTVGEPLYPDMSLPERERENDLTVRCHDAVCRLCGIDPKDNLYPALFNDSDRIDYYTDTYGIGYKGSH